MDHDEAVEMVDFAVVYRGILTEWEETFVDNMMEKLDKGRDYELTEKQAEALERIYKKCQRRHQ